MTSFEAFCARLKVRPLSSQEAQDANYQVMRARAEDYLDRLRSFADTDAVVAVGRRDVVAAAALQATDLSAATDRMDALQSRLSDELESARADHERRLVARSDERLEGMLESADSTALVYELGRAADALVELNRSPGAHVEAAALRALVRTGEDKLAASDFKNGLKSVKPWPGLLKRGRKNHEARTQKGQQTWQPLFVERDRIKKTVDPRIVAEIRDQIGTALTLAVAPLLAASVTPADAQAVQQRLVALGGQIAQANAMAAGGDEDARLLIGQCQTRFDDSVVTRAAVMSTTERATFSRQLDRMQSLLEQGLFGDLMGLADAFIREWDQSIAAAEEQAVRWRDDALPRIEGRQAVCRGWLLDPLAGVQSPSPADLQKRLETLSVVRPGGDESLAVAFQRLRAIEAAMDRIAAIVAARPALDEAIRATELRFPPLEQEFRTAMLAIRVPSGAADQISGDGRSVLYGEMESIKSRWKDAKKRAQAAAQLDGEGIVRAMQALVARAKAVTRDDYIKLAWQDAIEQKRASFNSSRDETLVMLEVLLAYGTDHHDAFRERIEAAHGQCRSAAHVEDVDRLILVVQGISREILVVKGQLMNRQVELLQECETQSDAVAASLQEFDGLVERYDQSFLTANPEYKAYAETLSKSYTEARGLATQHDLELLEQGRDSLMQLKAQIATAHGGLSRGADGSATVAVLENVVRQIAQCRRVLTDSTFKAYQGETCAKLTKELAVIDSNKTGRAFEDSMKDLQSLARRARAGSAAAQTAESAYKAFAVDVTAAKKELKVKQFRDQADYKAQLLKQLDQCQASGKVEGQLSTAQAELAEVRAEVARVVAEPNAMQQGGDLVRAVKEGVARDKLEFETLYRDHFQRQLLPQVKAALQELGDTKQYKELVELGVSTAKTFSKSKDAQLARMQLQVAIDRANDILAYPGGMMLHARGQLPAVNAKWHAAVVELRRSLEQVGTAVAAAEVTAKAETDKATGLVRDLFLERAFDPPVRVMTDAASDASAIRRAREQGLSLVRKYRAYVQTDRRLLELQRNPFVAPFRAITKINQALFSLERNLLISAK